MAYSKLNESIGKQIREYRENAGISQKEFAEMIGLTNRASLSLIENGEQAPSLEVLTKVIRVTKLDLLSLLSVEIKKYIVVDTNILLNRPDMLSRLQRDCDFVIIPRMVVRELNAQKDKGRELERRNASLCMSKIKEFRSRAPEKFLISDASVKGDSPDDEILQVAIDLSKEHSNDMVYMFTNDKDFGLKDTGDVTNLKVINSREYSNIFVEEDGFNDALSQRFFMAVLKGNVDQAKTLIKKSGRNINVNFIDTRSGMTPLIKAVKNKDHAMVEFLLSLDRLDIDAVDNFKHKIPALSHAIQSHDFPMVELLVNNNANVNEPSQNDTNYFNTPLMIAAWEGQLRCVRLLVENGACINQQDKKNGFTPLIKAVFRDKNDIVKYLLDKNADRSIFSFEKMTALDYAYKNKNSAIIDMLREERKLPEND